MKNTQTKINLFSTPVVIENDIYRLDDTEMNFLKSLPLRKLDFNSISQSILILDNTEMSKISMIIDYYVCLLYTSPSPRDRTRSRMPSSA